MHYLGKTYPLTQEAFNKVLRELEARMEQVEQLQAEYYCEFCDCSNCSSKWIKFNQGEKK